MALAVTACNSILDFDQFKVGALDDAGGASSNDAGNDGSTNPDGGTDAGDGGVTNCGAIDLTTTCFPLSCNPATSDQFLNACDDGTCVHFDPARIASQLVGGKLPTFDGGVQP